MEKPLSYLDVYPDLVDPFTDERVWSDEDSLHMRDFYCESQDEEINMERE